MTDEVTVTQPDAAVQARRTAYNRIVREATLLSLNLKNLNMVVADGYPPEDEDRRFSYNRRLVNFLYMEKEEGIVCDIEWSVEVKNKRKKYAKCVSLYRVFYSDIRDVPEDVARLYAENVAFAATYTYFRSLYASLDWAAGVGSPPLPTVKFMPKL